MTDIFDREKRSALMARVKSSGTAPERRLAASLSSIGMLPAGRKPSAAGRPDFAWGSAKVAVFVDGCFWHACPLHFRMPSDNRDFWEAKILANRLRDALVDKTLAENGWLVMRTWEHGISSEKSSLAFARRIASAVAARRGEDPGDEDNHDFPLLPDPVGDDPP